MAKRPQQQLAPTGEWGLPDQEILAALGAFVLGWSGVEMSVEVGIAKLTGLPPLESSTITAGLMFQGRAKILLSLLDQEPVTNAKAIKVIKKMQGFSDRNDILHGVVGGSKELVWFNRRKTDTKFTSKIERYDRRRLLMAAITCSDMSTDLQKALDISNEESVQFFQIAHNLANGHPTSTGKDK